ncbi:MAG: transporter substrate-binding domain-containing protein [Candidatus Muiribacteriota bacterium]
MNNKICIFLLICIILISAGCNVNQDRLEQIQDRNEFIVAGSGGYPPFNFYEGNEVVGFDVDTGYAIAEELGVELNYITSDWDGLIEGLRAGRYDAILGSMAITEEREEIVDFTHPYYYSGAQLVVKKNEDGSYFKPEDMEGKEIGVVTATNFVQDAESLGAEAVYYQDDNQTLTELIKGRIDGVITDRLVAVEALSKISGGENLVLSGELIRLEKMAIAVNKNQGTLLEKLNEIIDKLHNNGTLTEISAKWHDGEDITKQ